MISYTILFCLSNTVSCSFKHHHLVWYGVFLLIK